VQGAADGDIMSLKYTINVTKNHDQVTADWDIRTDMSDTEIIASFILNVEGKPLDTQCSGGNKACKSAAYATLSKPAADCPVNFVISTNNLDVYKDNDVLRGDKTYDDVHFTQ
jgi:hypothetical protein